MKKLALALLVSLSSPALADGLSFTSISCGDHWFKVSAEVDEAAMSARVTFGGDSVQDDQVHAATVTDAGDVVIALSGRDDALIVDDFDAVHDLFWGSYRSGDQVTSLGLCDAD